MTTTTVSADTTDPLALATASIDRTQNGITANQDGTMVHIGGGIYLTAGHVLYQFVNPGAPRTADDYRITVADGLNSPYTLTIDAADFGDSFVNYGWGTVDAPDIAAAITGDTTPANVPIIVYADPDEATGQLTSFGYPIGGGYDGETLVQVTGMLSAGAHLDIDIPNGTQTVFLSDPGMEVTAGQSGSGVWVTNDIDGDGRQETYLLGIVTLDISYSDGSPGVGFEPLGDVLADLGATILAAGLSADQFARATLVSGQANGSTFTTVAGTVLHEDLLGGVNADTLDGSGGNDNLYGYAGADDLSGGAGRDWLYGGTDADVLSDGAGKDNLIGGAGADRYVLAADGDADTIRDFEVGIDLLDLSAWGVTAHDELTIFRHPNGKVFVNYAGERLAVDDGTRSLQASELSADQFIFTAGNEPLPRIDGTDGNDKIFGTDMAEEIFDGAGVDNLFGRGGADVFILAADGRVDSVKDFTLGADVLDVSAWGATGLDDLQIVDHASGKAIIYYGDEVLAVNDGAFTMDASSFTAADFIFA
ncbi:MAG: hypothetical protein AAF439_03590 [Pseudomonadota bacterium]